MNKTDELVKNPPHYKFFDVEAINILEKSLTKEEFRGFCKGSALKYRLRAGKKINAVQDIQKALEFEEIYKRYLRKKEEGRRMKDEG